MSIEGRCKNVRERLIKMSAEDRKWRAQWLKDQHLSPNEPRSVQGFNSQSAKYSPYVTLEENGRQQFTEPFIAIDCILFCLKF